MLNSTDAALFAQSFAPWDRLSPQEQAFLTEHATLMHYKKGANLHSGDAECLGLLILKTAPYAPICSPRTAGRSPYTGWDLGRPAYCPPPA